MEIYIDEKYADSIIKISKSFDVEAKVIGRSEKAKSKKLTISTKFGSYIINVRKAKTNTNRFLEVEKKLSSADACLI